MIKVLKYVEGVLSSDITTTNLVGDDIYPNIVPDKNNDGIIKFPHIVMNRSNIISTYAKGCNGHQDEAIVELIIWSEFYFEGTDIAEAARLAMDASSGTINDFTVKSVRLESADEGFDKVAYYQRLAFRLRK